MFFFHTIQNTMIYYIYLVRKDMPVDEHERLSKTQIR
jgi:hypothetical protein